MGRLIWNIGVLASRIVPVKPLLNCLACFAASPPNRRSHSIAQNKNGNITQLVRLNGLWKDNKKVLDAIVAAAKALNVHISTCVSFQWCLPFRNKAAQKQPLRKARPPKSGVKKGMTSPLTSRHSLFPIITALKHPPSISIDQLASRNVFGQNFRGKAMAVKMDLPQL